MPPVRDETTDHTRSTGAYAQPTATTPRIDDVENDFARSTGAYPMEKEPRTVYVDNDEDLTRSTMAYPMYDDVDDLPGAALAQLGEVAAAAAATPGVTTVVVAATSADVGYPTPGPISRGLTDTRIAAQREELGLTPDPSGEADAGYQARPSTVAVPGADGIGRSADPATPETTGDDQTGDDQTGDDQTGDDQTGDDQTGDDQTGDDQTGDDQSDVEPVTQKQTSASGKAAPAGAESKVVKPPVAARPARRVQAEGK